MELYGGLRVDYWCNRLAVSGCDDERVSGWLMMEYSFFQHGDLPNKICDSDGVMHPNYCAFKSQQCLQRNEGIYQVYREACKKHKTYKVLDDEMGEAAILRWTQKFLSLAAG
nr:PREDICTED: acrosin-binding protein [Latimeria chalumnae]|eukprot:XP_006006535.1 PREDICTED: acrosin-binding protein [Latimeria chalumnae]